MNKCILRTRILLFLTLTGLNALAVSTPTINATRNGESVNVRWGGVNASELDHYVLHSNIGTLYSGTATSYTDSQADSTSTWSYYVEAWGKDGTTARSDTVTVSSDGSSSGGSFEIEASDGTSTEGVEITWSAVGGAAGYRVVRGNNSNMDYASILVETVTGTSYTDTTATAGKTYYYWIVAKKSSGSIAGVSSPDTGYRASGSDVGGGSGRTYTATLDGVTWTYTVSKGNASVGSGNYDGPCAVPTSTTGAITIPSALGGYPVRSIGEYAFKGCSGLTSVTIPSSVTRIGYLAFWECGGLKSVTIPSSVTNIEEGTFEGCSSLTSVTIPFSVTNIEMHAFEGCSSLTSVTIPSSVTNIGMHAFQYCSSLSSIAIPSSVTSIGGYAFYGCSDLASVAISSSVTSIGSCAFMHCIGLTSLTIPNSVKSIGASAFMGCKGLTFVKLSNKLKTIEGTLFAGCDALTPVTIPSSVTAIQEHAFYNCSGLTSVTIPSSVVFVGKGAFYNCSGLTSVTIPSSVTSSDAYFKEEVFYGCTSIRSVAFPLDSKKKFLLSLLFPDAYTSITDVLISAGAKTKALGSEELKDASGITSVTISDSVTSILEDAFKSCSKMKTLSIPVALQSQVSTWQLPSTCQVIVRTTYYVKFNANGGSGTMANQSFTYGTAQKLTANAFTRTGHTFTGWAKSSSGAQAHNDDP